MAARPGDLVVSIRAYSMVWYAEMSWNLDTLRIIPSQLDSRAAMIATTAISRRAPIRRPVDRIAASSEPAAK